MQEQWERRSAMVKAETMQRRWGPECAAFCGLQQVSKDKIHLTNHSELLKPHQVRNLGI